MPIPRWNPLIELFRPTALHPGLIGSLRQSRMSFGLAASVAQPVDAGIRRRLDLFAGMH